MDDLIALARIWLLLAVATRAAVLFALILVIAVGGLIVAGGADLTISWRPHG